MDEANERRAFEEGREAEARRRSKPDAQAEYNRHTTARLSCEYLTQLEAAGKPIPDYAQTWWANHKRQDELRRRAEAKKPEPGASDQ